MNSSFNFNFFGLVFMLYIKIIRKIIIIEKLVYIIYNKLDHLCQYTSLCKHEKPSFSSLIHRICRNSSIIY